MRSQTKRKTKTLLIPEHYRNAERMIQLLRGQVEPIRSAETVEQMTKLHIAINDLVGDDWGKLEPFRKIINEQGMSEIEELARKLEELPTVTRAELDLADYATMYYILDCDGCWIPCYNAEENPRNGWLFAGIRHTDGSTETIASRPGHWAHCTADELPCMPWAWDGRDNEFPEIWRKSA